MKLQTLVLMIAAFFHNGNCWESPFGGGKNPRKDVILSCKNSSGFVAESLHSVHFVEYEIQNDRESACSIDYCHIQPNDGLQVLKIRYEKYAPNFRDNDVNFPMKTWKDKRLGVELDGSTVIFSPNITAFRYELPRKIISFHGTFQLRCTETPLKKATKKPAPESPTITTSEAPVKISSVHIIVIVIVISLAFLIVVGIAITIFVCKHKKQTEKKTAYPVDADKSKQMLNNTRYSSLNMPNRGNRDETRTGTWSPINPDATPLYIDPEKDCATVAPDHYDNHNTKTSEPQDYSYTYMDTTVGKLKSVGPKNAPKKALIPPKKPFKPKSAWQEGNVYFRECSELHYEDVQTPKPVEPKYVNVV